MTMVWVLLSTVVYLALWAGLRPIMKRPYQPRVERAATHKRFLLGSWSGWFVPAVFPPIPMLILAGFTEFVTCESVDDFSKLVTGQAFCVAFVGLLFVAFSRLPVPRAMTSAVLASYALYVPSLILGVWDVIGTVIIFGFAVIGNVYKIMKEEERKHRAKTDSSQPDKQRS